MRLIASLLVCLGLAGSATAGGYTYYNAHVSHGRHYPAGYYNWTGSAWYRHGYGYEYGTPVLQQPAYYPQAQYPCQQPQTPVASKVGTNVNLDELLETIVKMQKIQLQMQQFQQLQRQLQEQPVPQPQQPK